MADAKPDQGNEPQRGLAVVVLDTYDDPGVGRLPLIRSEMTRITELFGGLGFTEAAEDLVGEDGRSLSLRLQLARWDPSPSWMLVYWVGHGRPTGEGDIWLYAQDTGREPEPGITLTGRDLGQILAGKTVDVIVLILDACQAGVGARVITGAFATAVEQKASTKLLEPSLAVITSAGPNEYAREGVFSSALIQVLREGPPEDSSTDWWTESDTHILPAELAAAVRVILQQKNARQGPTLHIQGTHPMKKLFRNPRHIAGLEVEVEAKHRRAFLSKDVREHFMLKFRGIDTADERGWYFTGREQPLREIAEWLHTARSGLLLVTGPPGCGKSAVLGRLAVLSDKGYRGEAEEARALISLTPDTDPGVGSISAGIHAKNKTTLDCIGELADALEIPAPPNGWQDIRDLLTAISDRKKPYTVLLDALDEARPSDLMAIAHDLLHGLASLPDVRVVVGSRPDRDRSEQPDPSGGSGDGPLLRALAADRVVRLDADPNAVAAVADYAEQRLQDVLTSPYASEPEAARRTAEAVARHSEGIFLFGRLLARTLARRSEILDLSSAEAQQLLSGSVAETVAADLDRYGQDRQRVRDLLTPLAWTEGAGLPRREVWLAVANALAGDEPGRHHDESDLGWLLDHAGAYLIQSGEDGQTVYRLYHQAFNDHLRRGHDLTAVHAKITDTLLALAGRNGVVDWPNANPYLHRHLATHAAAAGQLEALVGDSRYLLYADTLRLARVLGGLDHRTHILARLYWRALDRLRDATPAERAEILQATALGSEPDAVRHLHTDVELPWRGRWASGPATPFHRRLTGHLESVQTVAIEQLGGRALIISGGKDQTVRVWNADTGESEAVLTGHAGWVQNVAIAPADLGSMLVSGGDRTVRVWDADSGEQRWVRSDDAGVVAVAIGRVDDQPVIVSGGNDQTLRLWDALTGEEQRLLEGQGPVQAVAIGELDDQTVIVSGGDDHTIRIWNAQTGGEQATLNGHRDTVHAVAIGQLDDQPVIVSGGNDATIRIWNARSRDQEKPLYGHSGAVHALAIGQLRGQPVIISGGMDRSVRVWEPLHRTRRLRSIPSGYGSVKALAVGQVDGRALIVSGGNDQTIRIWDAHTGRQRRTLDDHTGSVDTVALGNVAGRALIVSGSSDQTIRIWDAHTGQQKTILKGHTDRVHSVAFGKVDERPVIVSGSNDQTIRIWDAHTGAPRAVLRGHDAILGVAVGQIAGRPVIVSGGRDETIRIWDADTEEQADPSGSSDAVLAVAFGWIHGRPVIVSGGNDKTIYVWDADTGALHTTLTGPTDAALGVAIGDIHDRPVIVAAGGYDRMVYVWDADTSDPPIKLIGPNDAVLAVAIGELGDVPVIVAGGEDGAVYVWDAERIWHVDADELESDDPDTRELESDDPGVSQLEPDLIGQTDTVLAVAIGQIDGRPVIVSGVGDGTVYVWDPESQDPDDPVAELSGHTGEVLAVAIGRIGGRPVIVSAGGTDQTVRVWDAVTFKPRVVLNRLSEVVYAVAVEQVDDQIKIFVGGDDRIQALELLRLPG